MPTFSSRQLLRHLAFGGFFLLGGITTVIVASIGRAHSWGVPEFMLFALQLGWMTIASAVVWETIAFIKLLLHLSEPTAPPRRSSAAQQ